jgi:phage shock protein A
MTSMPSANQAIAEALQSLQLASEAQAQSMAQQRTLMGDAKGNQLTSNDNQYQTTPVMDAGELPILEKTVEDDGWGKLPPKLAKDLMEAKRERVSENYRSQVQAYFQAMSNKARTIKK